MERTTNFIVLLLALIVYTPVFAQNGEAKDHPLLSRYEGSSLISYAEDRYVSYPVYFPEDYEWKNIEGKFTSIIYQAPAGLAALEVHVNYEKALEGIGFETVQQFRSNCEIHKYVDALGEASMQLPEDHYSKMYVFNGLYSRYKKDGMNVVIMTVDSDGELFTSVDFIGDTEMELGKVKANADAIAAAIEKQGKISIYGITFDTGSASIKDSSKDALDEIAKYLKGHPSIKLYIVGHTDDTGSLELNLGLSQQRAKAVVDALVGSYGIDSGRLGSSGVGPYAPVASNLSEEGKAKNRRVELVRRLK